MTSPQPEPPSDPNPIAKDAFISPISRYYGEFTPQNLAFNANLQEFANRVSIICALETNGKLTPQDAYQQIFQLWTALAASEKNLLEDPSDEP
jgi:pyruvate-formate lyase-activating enzyme